MTREKLCCNVENKPPTTNPLIKSSKKKKKIIDEDGNEGILTPCVLSKE